MSEKAKDLIKEKNSPVFLHMKYYRYLQHIGIKMILRSIILILLKNYRSKEIHNKFLKKLPWENIKKNVKNWI